MKSSPPEETEPASPASREGIEVGVVVRPHGVQGELKVKLHNPASDAFADPRALWLETSSGRILGQVTWGQAEGGWALIRVAQSIDRDAAETLRGARLMRDRRGITLAEDEHLCADLVGCDVRDGEHRLGVVVAILSAGSADVLVIRDGDEERMIPLVDDWVTSVDTRAREIVVVGSEQWDPQ